MSLNFKQVLNKVNQNLSLLDHNQVKFINTIKGKTKLDIEDHKQVYTIYDLVNNKLIIEKAREYNADN